MNLFSNMIADVNKAERYLKQKAYYDLLCDINDCTLHSYYGDNIVPLANAHQAEDEFISKYANDVLEYLKHRDQKCTLIMYQPIALSSLKMLIDMKGGCDGTCYSKNYWDPSCTWNWSYTNDIYRNITNPINMLQRIILTIKGCTNKEFVQSIGLNVDMYNKPITINVELFPAITALDRRRVGQIVESIYKYL